MGRFGQAAREGGEVKTPTTADAARAARRLQESIGHGNAPWQLSGFRVQIDGRWFHLDVVRLIRESEPVNLARFVDELTPEHGGLTLCARCAMHIAEDGRYCAACAARVEDAEDANPRR